MARGWFGLFIPDRLSARPTADQLARVVHHPATFAPTAAEVLAPAWEPPFALPALADLGARDIVLRDGSVDSLSLSGRAFLAFADTLFALAPQLREVRFVAVRHLFRELVSCPHLTRLRAIGFAGNRLDATAARLLVASPHVHPLAELDLTGHALTADGEALVEERFGRRALLR